MRYLNLKLGTPLRRWRPGATRPALDIEARRALPLVLSLASIFAFGRYLAGPEAIEAKLSRGIEFTLRHTVHRDPVLDPRIVIYALGDSSLNELKQEEVELKDWALILKSLAAAKPRAIIIDKVFSAPLGRTEAPEFVSTLKSLDVPVTAAAFISATPIPSRALQPFSDLSQFLPPGANPETEMRALDWLPAQSGYPYGPSPDIQAAFKNIGHVNYAGNLMVSPLVRLGRRDWLPATALFSASSVSLKGGALYVEGTRVPLDSHGRAIVNLSHPEAYFDRTFRLSALLARARRGEPTNLPQDAIVLVLPAMFTGSTDWQPTPFGTLPGGYFIAALANSALSGNWVRTASWGWLPVLLAGLAGYLLVFLTSGLFSGPGFWLGLFGTATLLACGGLASFCYFNLEVPWLFSIASLSVMSVALLVENSRVARQRLISIGESEKDFASVIQSLREEEQGSGPRHGVRLGRYHLLETIGTGGMGEVYRAKIHGVGGFEKEFAVKRILATQWHKIDTLRLFEEEARVNSFLTHANIAQVFEFCRTNETYLLVMEFIHGKNLAQFLRQARESKIHVSVPLAARIISDVCAGLAYAHGKKDPLSRAPLNIVHRDISPQNIMLSYEGAVKLIDFGIAKGRFRSEDTTDGIIKGKFAYMSPEQARGGTVTLKSDLFAVGLILYELVTGAKILEGGTDIETIENVRECRIPPVTDLKPDLPPAIQAILKRCLAKDPDARYSDATALRRSLEDFLRDFPGITLPEALSEMLKLVFPSEYGVVVNPEEADMVTQGTPNIADLPTRRLMNGR